MLSLADYYSNMSEKLIFKICALDKSVRELYNPQLTFEDNSTHLDLFTPEDILIKANSTQKIKFNIYIKAIDSLNNRIGFYIFPNINIINTPLRFSVSPIVMNKNDNDVIQCFVDNISNIEYLLKKGTTIAKLCGIRMQSVNIVVKQE